MTSEFFAEWEQMRLKDSEANPDDDDMEYFRVEKSWSMTKIQGMLKCTTRDYNTISKGSLYKPTGGFIHGLKQIAFPDHYYG